MQLMIRFDGSQFKDADGLLLGALTLSAITGEPFEIDDIGRGSGTVGVTPFHLSALRTMARLCHAEFRGDAVRAKRIRFAPSRLPEAGDYVLDTGDATGRPMSMSVTPLIEMLVTALSVADGESLVTVRGTNVHPDTPSAFWLRETFLPTLEQAGYASGVEIERWGWYPDGGGECVLSISPRDTSEKTPLRWTQRGNIQHIWVTAALSTRMEERQGQTMVDRFVRGLEHDRALRATVETDIVRVRSMGAGSGLFVTIQTQGGVAGFEAVGDGTTQPATLAERCVNLVNDYLMSDAVFDPHTARALWLPLAVTKRAISMTTPRITGMHNLLESLTPRFLPLFCVIQRRIEGSSIELVPTK